MMRKMAELATVALTWLMLTAMAALTILLVVFGLLLGLPWGLATLALVAGLIGLVCWIHRPGQEGSG